MKINIPTPLRAYAGSQPTVTVAGATIAEALTSLITNHPDLKGHLYTPEGKLRSFVNIYLNDDDIRYLPAKESTATKDSDELTIIPSIAGGCYEIEDEAISDDENAQAAAAHGPWIPFDEVLAEYGLTVEKLLGRSC
ncbi:MAG TPA: MoaD/ThiS family protein [Acidobacteriaceae bacterium]|nr:MoaD/ThiS family protein [Acidobacteriaceae bacterium]